MNNKGQIALILIVILLFLLGLAFIFMTDGSSWTSMKQTCSGQYFTQYTYNWCEYPDGRIVNLDGYNLNYDEVKAGH